MTPGHCLSALRLTLFLFLCSSCASGATQSEIDYLASHMEVTVKTVDNLIDGQKHFQAELTLKNTGTQVIRRGNWALFFCVIRHIDRPRDEQPKELDYIRYGVNITHISGSLHKMEPTNEFRDITPNGETVITFLGVKWHAARTDWMPNWYVASDSPNVVPRTLLNTAGEKLEFVANFTEPRQWKRYDSDLYVPFSPSTRNDINNVNDLGKAPLLLLPTPAVIEADAEQIVHFGTNDWVIVVEKGDQILESAARFLSGKTGMPVVDKSPSFRSIRFIEGTPDVVVRGKRSNSSAAYELRIDTDGQWATITARTSTGAFYGVQSLVALWGENMKAPKVTIKDAPRFEYRGMHLDVSRNFHKKEYLLKLLDLMATYKLNKFHIHMSDDEGWRLEIPGLPELTEVGGKRCFDVKEENCVSTQLGSGPTTESTGSGYYTVAEYQEVLQYAADRHIEVIPEFDMPGHGHAAVVSMKKRHDDFIAKGNSTAALEYLLTDPDDSSKYDSFQMFHDNAINPCMDSTYSFVGHIVREVVNMHKDINPLTMFNFGGDEVAEGAWENSTICKDLMERLTNLHDAKDLKQHMVRKIANITAGYGLNLGGWEDGLLTRDHSPFEINQLPNEDVFGFAWRAKWETKDLSTRANELANANFKVVMGLATHLYFDHPYEPDPEERGYYWATRYTDTRKTFGFMPDDIYANIGFTLAGEPLTEEGFCKEVEGKSVCSPLEKPENIAGMQGHLWSETVRTPSQADSMIFPRFLALIERAWHKADWEEEKDVNTRKQKRDEDWEKFANTLGYRELRRLDKLDVAYHVPQPGAKIVNGQLLTNVAFPGLTVEYSKDGGKSWCTEKSVDVSGKMWVRTRSADGSRTSRIESLGDEARDIASSVIHNMQLVCITAFITVVASPWH